MSSAMTLTNVPNKDAHTDPETKYESVELLGEGAFGKVAMCRNRATNEIVAVKVIKKDKNMCANFRRELKMLEHISTLDPDVFNLVKFIEFFDFQDRQSMVFEMLDISVYDLMQEEFPFSLSQARPLAKQLLIALQGLQDVGVIHSDIKPDNIMLVYHREQPFKVKLIDFGLAKRVDQVYPGQMMQPIFVRAPEVTLGLPVWEAIDMWSLACCLLLFCYEAGEQFLGHSNFDNMTKLTHYLGTPAKELLDEALYAQKYFVSENNNWRLKTLQEFKESTGENPDMSEEQHSIYNLEELIKRSREFVSEQESNDRDAFHDLLSKMLEINAEKRITPAQALLHPFITMDHLPKSDDYTTEAHELMRVAETTYGPLQRESLEKIAEKQKNEAFGANDFTGCTDDGSTSVSFFNGSDESTGSPGEILVCQSQRSTGHYHTNGDVASQSSREKEPNKPTDPIGQNTSPGEIRLVSSELTNAEKTVNGEANERTIPAQDVNCETTQLTVSKDEGVDDIQQIEPGNGLDKVAVFESKMEGQSTEYNEILEDIDKLFQEDNVTEAQEEPVNCETSQTASKPDDAYIQQNELDNELDIIEILEEVKEDPSAAVAMEDIMNLLQDSEVTELLIGTEKDSRFTFSRLIPRPLRALFSRLWKLLRRRQNKPFFTKPKWIKRISVFSKRSTTSGPSKP